ncbi:uncharacterized protein LOC114183877 isoform X1 [Vigna unguiculata]|uniref:uncharacterized protein LOC114183877 isoform X1 n=1 Tax=Vigna unguiculata TaxID=3917 RepID=UPI001015CBEB|nr:uncharacterized protein LOC114183877 isoform X1 [Vigna unguiculata]XP_027926841.1 uncharacterized protein LOC114183877 isoform X1 [Vigna unguiculata]
MLPLPNLHHHCAKSLRSCRHRAKSSSPCEVTAVTVRSRLVTVACCFCALRLLASPCEVAYEVTPSLCRPHCPSLIRFLHLKELSVIDVGVKTAEVLAFFAGALLEKQIVFVCSNLWQRNG